MPRLSLNTFISSIGPQVQSWVNHIPSNGIWFFHFLAFKIRNILYLNEDGSREACSFQINRGQINRGLKSNIEKNLSQIKLVLHLLLQWSSCWNMLSPGRPLRMSTRHLGRNSFKEIHFQIFNCHMCSFLELMCLTVCWWPVHCAGNFLLFFLFLFSVFLPLYHRKSDFTQRESSYGTLPLCDGPIKGII